MSALPILIQVCPASLVFHNPSPNVPQYTLFGLLKSNAIHCGLVPFKDSYVLQPVLEDSIERSESCIAAIMIVMRGMKNTHFSYLSGLAFVASLLGWRCTNMKVKERMMI